MPKPLLLPIALILTLAPAHTVDRAVLLTLPAAQLTVHPERHQLVLELAPVDLPAGGAHHGAGHHGMMGLPPVALAEMPFDAAIHAFRVELVDAAGQPLPIELLHHFNVVDPDHRELFLPISRRMLAAGKETGEMRLPWLLFGSTVRQGTRLVANAMLHNPTDIDYRAVRARAVIEYVPAGRPWPLFQGYPFQLDVLFPWGDKSFDLPPGPSSRSFEASPMLSGVVVGIGGHVHEHATRIAFENATTGEVIWEAAPVLDSTGAVVGVPVGRLYSWTRLGARIDPAQRYRVTVQYHNPTGDTIPAGGMGVVGGLFVPDDPARWPVADTTDALYRNDLRHYLRLLPAQRAMVAAASTGVGSAPVPAPAPAHTHHH